MATSGVGKVMPSTMKSIDNYGPSQASNMARIQQINKMNQSINSSNSHGG